jgi:hypothetical protein
MIIPGTDDYRHRFLACNSPSGTIVSAVLGYFSISKLAVVSDIVILKDTNTIHERLRQEIATLFERRNRGPPERM